MSLVAPGGSGPPGCPLACRPVPHVCVIFPCLRPACVSAAKFVLSKGVKEKHSSGTCQKGKEDIIQDVCSRWTGEDSPQNAAQTAGDFRQGAELGGGTGDRTLLRGGTEGGAVSRTWLSRGPATPGRDGPKPGWGQEGAPRNPTEVWPGRPWPERTGQDDGATSVTAPGLDRRHWPTGGPVAGAWSEDCTVGGVARCPPYQRRTEGWRGRTLRSGGTPNRIEEAGTAEQAGVSGGASTLVPVPVSPGQEAAGWRRPQDP